MVIRVANGNVRALRDDGRTVHVTLACGDGCETRAEVSREDGARLKLGDEMELVLRSPQDAAPDGSQDAGSASAEKPRIQVNKGPRALHLTFRMAPDATPEHIRSILRRFLEEPDSMAWASGLPS